MRNDEQQKLLLPVDLTNADDGIVVLTSLGDFFIGLLNSAESVT